MIEDSELLHRYAEDASEPAFAELVGRHLAFVYSAALRQVGGDASAAQDVAQAVFTDLARKAAQLQHQRVLLGWLFTSTRYAAAKRVRSDQRRRAREQQAHAMDEMTRVDSPSIDWDELRPVLDGALHALNERDREAVLLRFFAGHGYGEIATRQSVSADAARLRVERALEKMRTALARHGVTSTAAALAMALANQPAAAIPAGLGATITASALVGASSGAGAILGFLAMNKLQIAIATVLAVAGASVYVVQAETGTQLSRELQQLHQANQRVAALQSDNVRLVREIASAQRLSDENLALQRSLAAEPPAPVAASAQANSSIASGDVFEVSRVERVPIATRSVSPKYPFELRRAGVEGDASIQVVVTKTGAVTDAIIVKATRPEFGEAALAAVQQWIFEPGQKDGAPCNTRVVIPIMFTLNPK